MQELRTTADTLYINIPMSIQISREKEKALTASKQAEKSLKNLEKVLKYTVFVKLQVKFYGICVCEICA